ncbi:conserved membrane hypothetical protein [Candidatus Desulfarcum epimagneticum]|uniref:EamA domain-containing protein n=1 Tax=uncultured Desulfobacteraceae bacterium TaxID=218296 RepID=A0A484HEW0_9BACT|nr:conserved membrane hypothetical protein [uncultured Desulfobacteraceae bacterium]
MNWLFFAFLSAISLALADFCMKLASNRISPSLAVLVYGATTFLVSLAWTGADFLKKEAFFVTAKGFLYALVVGLAFSGVTAFTYIAFAKGAKVSVAAPLIRLAGVIMAGAAGIMFLKESFSALYLLGALMVVAGVVLMVTR